MKKKRYDDGGMVDDDNTDDQKVYNSNMEELSDSERRPFRSEPVKAAKSKGKKDDGSYDRKEQRRGMMSGFGPNGKKEKNVVASALSRGRMPSASDLSGIKRPFKKGGSIDGCAVRGKTKGRMV